MPRARGGALSDYRHLRNTLYRTARTMGNWQPVLDGLATGNMDGLIRGLTRRGVRRLAGRAFSALSFGKGGTWGVIGEIALMLLGRAVGARGRR